MNNTTKKVITQELAQGTSQRKIEKITGVSQSQISRFKQANIEAIEHETRKFITALPDIVDQTIRDIKTSNQVSKVLAGEEFAEDLNPLLLDSKTMNTFMQLSYKKQADILRAVGMFPSNSTSIAIQNIFQEGSQTVISPIVMSALGAHIAQNLEDTDNEQDILSVDEDIVDI